MGDRGEPHRDVPQQPTAPEVVPKPDGEEMVDPGELPNQNLPQTPAVPVAEPGGARGSSSSEIIFEKEEVCPSLADRTTASMPADEQQQQPLGHDGSREIVSEEEEEDPPRAPPPHPPASVPAEEPLQQAPGRLNVESGGGLARSTNSRWGTLLCTLAHPKCAKWVYTTLFLGGILLAMSSRDMEVSGFSQMERVHGCEHDRYCLGAESALRVSLAFFLFFTVMFVTTVWTKKLNDYRNYWNSNLGVPLLIKIVLLLGCLYLVQVPPSSFIEFYGSVARVGAWLFLAIQLISVTKCIMWLNKWQQLNPEKRRWLMRAIAILSNFGSFGVILWLMHEHTSNIIDITVVSVTLMLMILMICIYLKSEVTTGWLAPGLMIAYVTYMCWTVIKSEPHRHSTKGKDRKSADWLTIASFIFVVIVMAYSTVSTGDDEWLQFNEEIASEDNIPYGYGYFHLVFALGSMYFGMLLVGWNAHQTLQRWTMDFGWWSAVVRVVNGFLAALLYIWMLRTAFIWNKTKLVLSWPGASLVPHVTFV